MDPKLATAPLPWGLICCAAGLGSLSFAVLVHGLHKVRSRDATEALSWWLGIGVATATGWQASLWLGLSGLLPAAVASPGPVMGGWVLLLLSSLALIGLQRQVPGHLVRPVAQSAALGLGHWAAGQWALQSLWPTSDAAALWSRAGPALGWLGLLSLGWISAAWVALGHAAALARLGSAMQRQWWGAGLFGVAVGGAQALAWQGLPTLDAATALPDGLGPSALWVLASVACITLLLGVCVGHVDWLARGRRAALAESLSQANRRLRDQALADPLTRLPNRLQFEERLSQALLQADQQGHALAVMFVDLDGFKPINDSFGHVAGDTVLREMARRLRQAARTGDLVARIGGDEFLLLAEDPGEAEGAAQLARRLLDNISKPVILPNTVEVKLSGSVGIVMYPEFGPGQKLLACADAAMYAAKRSGGSTYAFFDPSMEIDAREQLELQNDLRRALDRRELELFYQPKVEGRSGMITGVEALVRWHHPSRGLVMPGVFIPVAERFGLISKLGDWVIDEACRQLRAWLHQGLRMRVAINLSAHQLRQDGLHAHIEGCLKRHRVAANQLTIEIIESVLMEDDAVQAFSALASIGVSLSIDDFGIGYCNFALLRKLPVKQLKVDRSLFTDIQHSADARSVVIAIIKMAHALGLRVVAEGVETDAQRELLLKLQCDELQGYLFAKPMPADKLTLWAMGGTDHGPTADFRPSIYQEEPEQPTPAGSFF